MIDGGADQGGSKAHSRSKREQAIGFGRSHRLAADPEGFGCSPEHDRIAGWFGGRHKQERLRVRWEPSHLDHKVLLQTAANR